MALTLSAAIRRTRHELTESQQRTEALQGRLTALEQAAQELDGDDERRPRPDPGAVPRTDAILAVMREQPTVAWTTAQLKPLVSSLRHINEETKDLAAALSYLGQQRKVRSVSRGEWMLYDVPSDLETLPVESAPTGPPVGFDPDDIPF
jgi:hypothetical protein